MKKEQVIVDDLDVGNCEDCGVEINSNFKRCYSCHQLSIGKNNFKHKESEGEEYIAIFLTELGIDFNKQVEIHNLKNDKKYFRVADFKLTKFNVYIEYDGNFHNDRERYAEKKQVYESNNIPCIYLYPENLGALPFFFDKRMEAALKKYNRFTELRKYRWFKFFNGETNRLLGVGVIILFLIYLFTTGELSVEFVLFLGGIGIYQIFCIIKAYRDIFIKGSYPLEN